MIKTDMQGTKTQVGSSCSISLGIAHCARAEKELGYLLSTHEPNPLSKADKKNLGESYLNSISDVILLMAW